MRMLVWVGLLLALPGVAACSRVEQFTVHPVDGRLYHGLPPCRHSDFEKLQTAGIHTVLDLRAYRPLASQREAQLAAAHGLTYRHCPYPYLPCGIGRRTEQAYAQLLHCEDYPLYIHCEAHHERTPVLCGLYRVRCNGWSVEAAGQEMKRCAPRPWLGYGPSYFWKNAHGPSAGP
jgi:hypothetical protein